MIRIQAKYVTTFLLLLCFCSAFGQFNKEKKAEKHYQEESYFLAMNLFKDIVAERPTYSNYKKLADCYLKINKTDQAEIAYSKIVKYSQKTSQDVYTYCQLLKSNGKTDEYKKWLATYNDLPKEKNEQRINLDLKVISQSIISGDVEIKNIPINNRFSAFSPFVQNGIMYYISPDESTNPIRIRSGRNGEPFLNIQSVEIENDYSPVKTKLSQFNTKYNEGPLSISEDGKLVAFTRNNYKQKSSSKNHLQLFIATIYEDKIIEEAFPHNSPNYSVGHPTFANNGKRLIFASNMPGGEGGVDLYFSDLINGKWSKPKNLGKLINTPKNELFPFYHSKGILYFSSNGHPGFGGLDIFQAKIDNDLTYKELKNIGRPINHVKDDFGFFLNEDGISGFFSSNRIGSKGNDDIYSFQLKKVIHSTPSIATILVNGIVTDEKNSTPLPHAQIRLIDNKKNIIAQTITDENGAFSVETPVNSHCTVIASKDSYFEGRGLVSSLHLNQATTSIKLNLPLSEEKGYLYKGVAIDNTSGEPLSNVEVSVNDNGKIIETATTNEKGEYSFYLEEQKEYDFQFRKLDYKTKNWEDLKIASPSTGLLDEMTFELEKEFTIPSIEIYGKATDEKTGLPLVNCTVKAIDLDGNLHDETLSLDNGNYKLSIPIDGRFVIKANKKDFFEGKANLSTRFVNLSNRIKLNFELSKDKGYLFSGIAIDKISGNPVPNVQVEIADDNGLSLGEATTDQDGNYKFYMLDDKKYNFTFRKLDYKTESLQTINLEDISDFNIDLEPIVHSEKSTEWETIDIHGKISDEANGNSLKGAKVLLQRNGITVDNQVSDLNGEYHFSAVVGQNFKVKVMHTPYYNGEGVVTTHKLNKDHEIKLDLALSKDRGHLYKGIAINKITGESIRNEEILLMLEEDEIQSTTTNDDGEFTFYEKEKGNYSFKFRTLNYAFNELEQMNVEFNDDINISTLNDPIETKEIDPSTPILMIGKITSNSQPIQDVKVTLQNSNKMETTRQMTNEDGFYKFNLKKSTKYAVTAEKNGYNTGKGMIMTTDTEEFSKIRLDFQLLADSIHFKGKVINGTTHNPVSEVNVSLLKDNKIHSIAKTDIAGDYNFYVLQKGHYSFKFEKKDMFTGKLEGINADSTGLIDLPILKMLPKTKNETATIDIYFDVDKFNIGNEASEELDKLIDILQNNPTLKIELSSHTDSRGSDSYNLQLSKNRAKASVAYILSKGIGTDRIVGKGYGETKLINNCKNGVQCSAKEHKANRRTEVRILNF